MAIRLSGMMSGLDTDAMIDELVNAYSIKKDNIYKERKTLEYKTDAWKSLNSTVYGFYSKNLSSMRFASAYSKKAAVASNEAKVKVSADSNAVNGTQQLKVTSLAKTGYLTGAKLGSSITGSSKLSELGITDTSRITVKTGGKESYIDLNASTTVDQVVSKLKSAGVNASFDAVNKRFFVSSKTSGVEADFSLSGNDAAGTEALKNLGLYTYSSADAKSMQEYIDNVAADSQYISKLAKNEYLDGLLNKKLTAFNEEASTYQKNVNEQKQYMQFANLDDEKKTKTIEELQKKIEDAEKKLANLTEGTSEWQTANDSLEAQKKLLDKYEAIKNELGESKSEGYSDRLKAFTTEAQTVIDENNELIKTTKDNISALNKAKSGTIAAKEAYLGQDGFDYSDTAYTKIVDKYNEKLSYSQEMVNKYNAYQAAVAAGDTAAIAAYEEEFGLAQSADGAVRIEGSDAEIYLNGARFTSSSNSINVNGLNITAMGITEPGEEITITTSTDVQAIYDTIKDFFTEYNKVIKEMESKYNAESAKDYEPLTDEEMEEMTDKQIEKWEDKLSTAALRGDSTLSSVITAMKNVMSSSFEVNGQSLSLASFGIKTSGYFASAENERGVFHIDGDPDDSSTSGKTDKLMAALTNDMEGTVSFFTQLSSALYSKLSDKMSSSTVSSAYTLYNDKYMKQQDKRYGENLDKWEEKLEAIREKYEKQFAAMEKALSTLTSQQSQLSSLIGGGQQ